MLPLLPRRNLLGASENSLDKVVRYGLNPSFTEPASASTFPPMGTLYPHYCFQDQRRITLGAPEVRDDSDNDRVSFDHLYSDTPFVRKLQSKTFGTMRNKRCIMRLKIVVELLKNMWNVGSGRWRVGAVAVEREQTDLVGNSVRNSKTENQSKIRYSE